MADEHDPMLTGSAFDLANAGFTPMPDPHKKEEDETIGSDSASLREAAQQRAGSRDDINVRKYLDDDGKPVPADEAITLDRAVRDYASATSAEKFAVENESSKALAARIDAMRAEALAKDPDAAEFYGFEPPPAETGKTGSGKAASEEPQTEPAGLN